VQSLRIHDLNKSDIDYLYKYYRGDQPALYREKNVRKDICNKVIENRANEIVSFKVGYLCGEPIQYVGRKSGGNSNSKNKNRENRENVWNFKDGKNNENNENSNSKGSENSKSNWDVKNNEDRENSKYSSESSSEFSTENINALCDMMFDINKAMKDKQIVEWQMIAGTAYRIVLPKTNLRILGKDSTPFEIFTLDPRNTFIVYSTGIDERPLMGVTCWIEQAKNNQSSNKSNNQSNKNSKNNKNKKERSSLNQNTGYGNSYGNYINQTNNGAYNLSMINSIHSYTYCFSVYTDTEYFKIEQNKITEQKKHALGSIPIIEYPANDSRLGSFEPVITILDAINNIESNRVDSIEQNVQAILKFINCDIDRDTYQDMLSRGAVLIK
jgi:hypothetical protein